MDSFVLQDSLEWHVPRKVGTLEVQQQRRKPSVGHYEVDTDSKYTVCIETLRGPISHYDGE